MTEQQHEILKKIRTVSEDNPVRDYTFEEIEEKTGISAGMLSLHFKSEEVLVEKVLELEREKFREIFDENNFEGVNAIDILLTVSREISSKFNLVSPSFTFNLKEKYPKIYQDHFEKRIQFIFEKIQINISKGISQGMYRDDLSNELVARLYISRLIDLHNPDFFPPEKFSFQTLFQVMFENFIRSISRPEGLAYYQKKIRAAHLRDMK